MPGCINDSRSKFPISKVGAALLILLLQKGIIGKTNNIACETYAILPVFCICPFQKHIYICDLFAELSAGKPKLFINCKKLLTVAYENNETNDKRNDNPDRKVESIYSNRIRAGKRRTYFFDVRATRSNDYFLTITESRKRFDDNGYDRHKIFVYKEDFNKFIKALGEAVDYVKTELMPDFDFDAFNHDANPDEMNHENTPVSIPLPVIEALAEPIPVAEAEISPQKNNEEVDKW